MYKQFIAGLSQSLAAKIQFAITLKDYTSFKIGGEAEMFCQVESRLELLELLKKTAEHNIPVFILGKGTNLVISDEGIEGLVIHLGTKFSETKIFNHQEFAEEYQKLQTIKTLNNLRMIDNLTQFIANIPIKKAKNTEYFPDDKEFWVVKSEAGALLKEVSKLTTDHQLTGLEFACGIPGSLGGAVYMNAGAYGNDIEDCVFLTLAATKKGELCWIHGEEHLFSYRKSIFSLQDLIVIESYLLLRKAKNTENVALLVAEYTGRREASQPLEWPSAGSMFKRPEGYFAGKLIEEHNFKGVNIGGASVSQKHAGFIINKENASAKDVRELVSLIKTKIFKEKGIKLETEVRFVGKNADKI